MTAVRRASLMLPLIFFTGLVTVTGSQAAPPSPAPGTKTITVTRGGTTFERTVLDPVQLDGRLVRRGSVIVRFEQGVTSAGKSDAHRAAAAVDVDELRLARAERLEVRPGSEQHALAALRGRPDVEYAQLDGIVKADYIPNDTSFASLWGMTTIRAPQAWDVTKASSAVKIAILDCGIYSSSSTYPGPDGLGHVDVRSKVVQEANFTNAPDVDDYCNHGTHVAGTAAAVTNNGIGVAGAGHDAALLNGKVLGDDGSGSDAWIINGIVWAANNNADVINLSLGSDGPCPPAVQDAVSYAWNRGAVIVVAAGNEATNPGYLPLCANTLSVAATDSNDARASFSNFGSAVDVAAPGVGILSSNFVGTYSSFAGTSMAAPHVSGLAALVRASGVTTNAAVVGRITSTAVAIPGTGVYWTYGRVDALGAVQPPLPPPPLTNGPRVVDFDGDGKADLAFWRPSSGVWWVRGISSTQWGQAGDVPVPGDYNGDGKSDIAVWRPSSGVWWIRGISNTQWGQSGDVALRDGVAWAVLSSG